MDKEEKRKVVSFLNLQLPDPSKFRFVEAPTALLQHDYGKMNQKLHVFLDKLEKRYKLGIG